MEEKGSENKPERHPTNTKWVVWYHNPSDKNWGLDSYKDIIEIESIEDYFVLKNSWNMCLPGTNEGMFFLMRKADDKCIYPQWEDPSNRNGGYWSFKIVKEKSNEYWFKLFMCTIGECISEKVEDSLGINGISISPKKNFCIIKIWNNNSNNKTTGYLSKNLDFLDMNEVIYSCHEVNIKKDVDKIKKRELYRKNRHNNNNNIWGY